MVQASVSTGPLGDATRGDVAGLLGRSFTVRDVVNGPDGVTAIVEDDVPHDHLRRAVARVLRVARHLSEDEVFRSEPADWSGHDAQPAPEAAGDVRRLGPGLFTFGGGARRPGAAMSASPVAQRPPAAARSAGLAARGAR